MMDAFICAMSAEISTSQHFNIYHVSWTFHVHLWDEPGKWTTGLFSGKFMEKYEA